jgi:hypothetical protein
MVENGVEVKLKRLFLTFLILLSLLPIQIIPAKASVNLQLASAIDWNGLSLTRESGFSQIITPQNVPKAPFIGEWALNVGNSFGPNAPLGLSVMLSSSQFAIFSFFDVSSDYRFTQNGNTQCTGRTPNAFGAAGTFAVTCTTPISIVANQSYLLEVRPAPGSQNSTWTADLSTVGSGVRVNLGEIAFTSTQNSLASSRRMNAFNQISVYGPDLTCQNAPSVQSTFSRPKNSVLQEVTLQGTRPAKDCSNSTFMNRSDGTMEVFLGSGVIPPESINPSYHKGASLEAIFEPLGLSYGNSIEFEIKPFSITGDSIPENHPMPFSHYGLNWCWQTIESLQGTESCASLHLRPNIESVQGKKFGAVVDFFFQNATEIAPVEPKVNCELRKQKLFLGTPTYYTTCSRFVSLELNKSYILRVRPDRTKNAINWWVAQIVDKATGEYLEIGAIRSFGNLVNIPLARNSITYAYTGVSKECTSVPENDTLLSPPRGPKGNAKLIKIVEGFCVQLRFDKAQPKSLDSNCFPAFCDSYFLTFGGSDAKSRNLDKYDNSALTTDTKNSSSEKSKNSLSQPVLNQINFVGNELNINIGLGDSKPDNVLLIAPQLTQNKDGKIPGKISGSNAEWTIKLPSALSGTLIPITLVSLKVGVESDPITTQVQVPNLQSGESTLAPKAPQKLRSNFLGAELLITAQIEVSGKAIPKQGFLYAPAVGISQAKPIKAETIGNKMIFSIPVGARDRGKVVKYFVYSSNQAGRSPISSGTYSIPKLPVIQPVKPPAVTITCVKGNQLRTFISEKCPPGWSAS